MTAPRFLQVHTLHSYAAALLNRDDQGLAKRLPYGNAMRTRISSQCLKRHWRMADHDPHALRKITGAENSFRSRELVTEKVIARLRGRYPDEVIDELEPEFQKAIYGEKAAGGKKNRPPLILGEPEIIWLQSEAEKLAAVAVTADETKIAVSSWARNFKENIGVLRENTKLPGGLTAAMFGRMVTSDPAANIEAPVHVAHAFTVHAEESEVDYFTAIDDLKREDCTNGADMIQETELTCGLFYGYVVVDLPGLIDNCGGDRELAGQVVHNLLYLIAEVSPGAKLGSTAPYGRAEFMLVEAGDRQPRSLAGAYRQPVTNDLAKAVPALDQHLAMLDEAYETDEVRGYVSLAPLPLRERRDQKKMTLRELSAWAADCVKEAPDA